ncbi:leucine--tRNA ligase [Candidatus Borreliella tachyglossi]|uniref:Leucine--tRNA ligase n=1 Tax=Candidatus Borreliella tachyglossi TaxID=1964448 RepID=A0A2S1LWH6_9SPIR|nr:leucine--tRNA ligase [Candidatus Borreliella tachyglossi]AWG42641.1 leucine--tRNA ligase [Candidatus Borreliella tachyglossi]
MLEYNFKKIEKKWQHYWDQNKTYRAEEDLSIPKEKRVYILDMFPYPSANGLHVGHPEGYTATDIVSRYKFLNGFNVLHPIGFDSFGLPAENYAIQTGEHPKKITEENIARFRKQIKALGFAYDWDREIRTHDESYYKWTQWIFLKLYKKGLAYTKEMPVWYCPDLGTVLSNEEVLQTPHGPKSERGLHKVERKLLRQWILKITEYADRLIEDLEELDWPESVKEMQKNWIGKSTGVEIEFEVKESEEKIKVFTTRPDTLFGITYLVLAPESTIVERITKDELKAIISEYRSRESLKSDLERTSLEKDKTGVFTGAYAINPITQEEIPIWIGSYVLGTYGTGAVMGVPAHDERDFGFAKKYNLEIKQVVSKTGNNSILEKPVIEDGISINTPEGFNTLQTAEVKRKVIEWLTENKKGQKKVNYKLRDWIFSRQRYWGEPIPIMLDDDLNEIPLEEDELPLRLPEIENYKPSGTGESPLARSKEWVNVKHNGKAYKRETNTMPQWAGSCWYYMRYLDPTNEKEFASKEKINYWMPVDLYIGGAEHSVLHLLYARFWHKVLYDLGYVNTKEPFKKLINQGMITSFAYQDNNGILIPNDEVEERDNKFFSKSNKKELKQIVAKMSKSLKNIVNPDDIIKEYGADSMRIYEMFMGPLTDSKPWNTKGLIGIFRFLNKIWTLKRKELTKEVAPKDIVSELHKTIKKVTEDIENLNFNTAISSLMILINDLLKHDKNYLEIFKPLTIILSPFAPHLGEELWEYMGERPSIFKTAKWPQYDPNLIIDYEKEIVLQVNGKIRDKIILNKGINEETLKEIALKNNKIMQNLENKEILKIVTVKDKLINIVTR